MPKMQKEDIELESYSYKDAVKKLYCKPFPADDSSYVYSLRHRVGFYQTMMDLKGLIEILNRNQVKLSRFKFILDLGCGIGIWLRIISEIRGAAEGLVGIDLSEERLRHANRINKNIGWIKSDMCQLPFEDGAFDFIIAFTSFMFLTDEKSFKQSINESARILKNRGFLLFYDMLGENKDKKTEGSWFIRGFKKAEVKDLFAQVGLVLVDEQTCFRNIFGLKNLSTSSLCAKIPIEILLWLEKFPISQPTNIFLLFRKEGKEAQL